MTNKLKMGLVYQPNSEFKTELNGETEITRNNVWIFIAIALLQVWLVYKTSREKENKS